MLIKIQSNKNIAATMYFLESFFNINKGSQLYYMAYFTLFIVKFASNAKNKLNMYYKVKTPFVSNANFTRYRHTAKIVYANTKFPNTNIIKCILDILLIIATFILIYERVFMAELLEVLN
jgi:ABC-type transport system involved in cytochrome c biogenesis permease subunit